MEKIRENFKDYVSELDEMLYYNEEDLKRQIYEYETEQAEKKGIEKGKKQSQKEIIKNMLNEGVEDNLIMKYLNIDEKTLNELKCK